MVKTKVHVWATHTEELWLIVLRKKEFAHTSQEVTSSTDPGIPTKGNQPSILILDSLKIYVSHIGGQQFIQQTHVIGLSFNHVGEEQVVSVRQDVL